MSESHDFCRLLLKQVRNEAKEKKIKVPRLSTWVTRIGTNPWGEVRNYSTGEIIWQDTCHCVFEARALAIETLIPGEETNG